jgi:hypothetical protein
MSELESGRGAVENGHLDCVHVILWLLAMIQVEKLQTSNMIDTRFASIS